MIDQRPTTKKQMKSSSHFLAMAIVLVSLGPIIRNISSLGWCSLCLLRCLTLFTAMQRVFVFAESVLSLPCHLPFWTHVHVHQHQCTRPPPSLKSQSRKGSDWWVGWVFYPYHHCSWHPSTSRHGPSAPWAAPGCRKKRNTDQLENTFWDYRIAEKYRATPEVWEVQLVGRVS